MILLPKNFCSPKIKEHLYWQHCLSVMTDLCVGQLCELTRKCSRKMSEHVVFAKFMLCKWLQWHSPVWVAHRARLMCHPLGRFVALKLSCSGAVTKLHYAWGVPVNTTTKTTHEGPTSTLAIRMPSPIPPPHVWHERKKK